jgi:hypothetical protein
MKPNITILLLGLLIGLVHSAIHHKLSSLGPSTLTPSDYLTSALGQFRITLKPITCQLQL